MLSNRVWSRTKKSFSFFDYCSSIKVIQIKSTKTVFLKLEIDSDDWVLNIAVIILMLKNSWEMWIKQILKKYAYSLKSSKYYGTELSVYGPIILYTYIVFYIKSKHFKICKLLSLLISHLQKYMCLALLDQRFFFTQK